MTIPRKARLVGVGVALAGAASLVLAQAPLAFAADGDAATCFGKEVTIVGTEGPDLKIGTFGSDVIATLGGPDIARGEGDVSGIPGGDTDYICLGDGDDVFADGAWGADFLDGGRGNDVLDGDNFPSPFGDTLVGGEGNDTFTGGMGDDTIEGGPGNDVIDPPGVGIAVPPSAGADKINAGEGDDVITEQVDGGVDEIDAGDGNDTCVVDAADKVENCEQVITVPAVG